MKFLNDQEYKACVEKHGEHAIKKLINECMVVPAQTTNAYNRILTQCKHVQKLKELAVILATTKQPVMITGPSGTGKELFARLLHGNRDPKKFVGVNCSGIPDTLLEAEFFGSTKGAFTGAVTGRSGYLGQADHGTLFLDEIGDMPPLLQCKLLRALETRTYRKIGGETDLQMNCRIVSATHQPPTNIRQDLYHRLAVITLDIPPLGERLADARLIAESKLGTESANEFFTEFAKQTMWEGNVRELLNCIEKFKLQQKVKAIQERDKT